MTPTTGSAQNRFLWPDGKRFAFTVFDDTDHATLDNNRAIYGLLRDLGMRTTKSIWVFDGEGKAEISGVTCADTHYLALMQELQREGFEIGWHNATWSTSERAMTIRGLDRFKELFGHDPLTMANHASNREGIYWGAARLSGWRALAYRFAGGKTFEGHRTESPLFWGDACLARLKYVRNFVFREVNTLEVCPMMPYRDAKRPFVNQWFASTDAGDVDQWNATFNEAAIDKLEAYGGACIVYTHFGKWFHQHGAVDSRFEAMLRYVASKNAWFPTVAELLDHLALRQTTPSIITNQERKQLENRWLSHTVRQRF